MNPMRNIFTALVASIMMISTIHAQRICCTNYGILAPTPAWQIVSQTNSGYYTFNATAGCIYTFTHCQGGGTATSGSDPYLTVADNACSAITWNDDWCGLLSELTWTAPATATYQIHLGSYGGSGCDPIVRDLAYREYCPTPMCYSASAIAYAPDPFAGTTVALGDDQYSGVIPIGFNFCFDNSTYSNLLISSNGYITFNTGGAWGYSPWSIGAAIPSASDPTEAIMATWMDLYPPGGGTISYQVLGSAPNRRFVVSWNAVPFYSCWSTVLNAQVKLYETTNCIEILLENKQVCVGWNGGYGIEGIHNAVGTQALVIAGRNYPTQWTAMNDAYQISPTCAPCNTSGSCIVPLPVELLSFTAQPENNRVHVQWTTASETNNDYYTVERSFDGVNYEQVAMVDGTGNSTSNINYETYDDLPYPGTSYYRLIQTDFNGTREIFGPVAVHMPSGENFIAVVYPVPADAAGINFSLYVPLEGEVKIEFYDLPGKQLDSKTFYLAQGYQNINMNESGILAPGVYIVRTSYMGNKVDRKIIIQ